jgi:Spy/CpxP family protein refolding chaperone
MRGTTVALGLAAAIGVAAGAGAQQKGSGSGSGTGSERPYAGQQAREVSAFTDDEVRQHREGRGLGYARSAELNGHPGPMHVLELATELNLTEAQAAAVKAIQARMSERARAAGEAYMEAEKAIDAAFRSGTADAETVARLVQEADRRRAETRLAHLIAHLETTPILTPEQRARYAELRGYKGTR